MSWAVKFNWSMVLIVSATEGLSTSAGSGEGETISMYLGVNTNTREIRKNAKRVFLSILSYWVLATLKKRVTSKQSKDYEIGSQKQGLLFNSLNSII